MPDPEYQPSSASGRNETREEQLDRNWGELLQELRVLQTGLYLANVVVATLTTALVLLPVSVHRRLFRKRLKETLVSTADSITKVALGAVAALSIGTAALVFDVTAGRTAGLTAGGVLLAVLLVLLVYVPLHLNRRAAGK